MNEKIKALAIESALLTQTGEPRYCGEAQDIQRFAESIIRECAYVWLMNPKAHPNVILEHFGVGNDST